MLPTWVCSSSLTLSKQSFLIIVGLLFIAWEQNFKRALFFMGLVAIGLLSKDFLKNIFKIPLPYTTETYAFPSGHMHMAIIIYGWIYWRLTRPANLAITLFFGAALLGLLYLIATSLVQCGFHTWMDIAGSVLSGSLLLILATRVFAE